MTITTYTEIVNDENTDHHVLRMNNGKWMAMFIPNDTDSAISPKFSTRSKAEAWLIAKINA